MNPTIGLKSIPFVRTWNIGIEIWFAKAIKRSRDRSIVWITAESSSKKLSVAWPSGSSSTSMPVFFWTSDRPAESLQSRSLMQTTWFCRLAPTTTCSSEEQIRRKRCEMCCIRWYKSRAIASLIKKGLNTHSRYWIGNLPGSEVDSQWKAWFKEHPSSL